MPTSASAPLVAPAVEASASDLPRPSHSPRATAAYAHYVPALLDS